MKLNVKTNWAVYENCNLVSNEYLHSGSICLEITSHTEGPIARITTCLEPLESNFGYVDTNNCPWAEEFITEYNLGKPTGEYRNSGFCSYPLYEFDMDEIAKYED